MATLTAPRMGYELAYATDTLREIQSSYPFSPSINAHIEPVTQDLDELQFDAQQYVMFCRALYDYKADDPSALSFQKGNIIEVLSLQPSGWWDGLLNDKRGWFPSNYVEVIPDEEADRALSGLGALEFKPVIPMQDIHSIARPVTDMSTYTHERLNTAPNRNDGRATPTLQNDFWIPEVTANGQIYYVNTKTGQRSRDLPRETEDEVSDNDLPGLDFPKASQSGDSDRLGIVSYNDTGTVEDNEQSTNREILVSATTSPHSVTISRPDNHNLPLRGATDGKGPYDDSDSPSSEHSLSTREQTDASSHTEITKLTSQPRSSLVAKIVISQQTSDERIAKALEKALEPQSPSSNVITDLAFAVTIAIQNVIRNVQSSGAPRKAEDDKKMDKLIYNVVLAVQNLLYISAASPAHQAADTSPGSNPIGQSLTSSLKAPQRKVTAILSRLVLSARALEYNSGSPLPETLVRIESDAVELQKDINSFVLEVQRVGQGQSAIEAKNIKRIQGFFATTNTGLGLVGGGSAASWKGFGYHFRDDNKGVPQKTLDADVILEIDLSVDRLQRRILALQEAIRLTNIDPVHQVCSAVQELVTHTSTFLSFIADVYVARHIDIDGIRQGGHSLNSDYTRMVNDARQLLRNMEAVVQAIYDDSSSLLLTTQTLHDGPRNAFSSEREDSYTILNNLSSSLSSNFGCVKRIFGGLLSLGYEQAEVAQGDYKESIDWRFSGISAIKIDLATDLEEDDQNPNREMVDIELAFQRTGHRNSYSYESYPALQASGSFPEDSPQDMPLNETSLSSRFPMNIKDGDTESIDANVKTTPRPSGSAKLQRLLGDEYADKVAADLRPWYLRADYSASDIIIDADNSVRGGTLSALVERLTAHDQADTTFTKAFLVTYKSFTTLDELFDFLVARFRLQEPENLTHAEKEEWVKLKQHVIRTRVINTMKTMVDGMLDLEDMYILDRMKDFVSSDEVSTSAAAKNLLVQIERTKKMGDAKTLVNTNQEPSPLPIIPKSSKKLKLLDIDPLELARQFTIIESQLYQKIKPIEGLHRARVQRIEHDDDISAVIQTSNRIAEWIAECILSKEDPRRRAQVIKHLISVADRCRLLNNFSTMSAITSGLNKPPIRRLKKTWDQISQRYMAQFAACEVTIDNTKNFNKYKSFMTSVTPPCVPFLGVFLSTLQFIQDGNPDKLSGEMINFRKFQKASEVISDIKRWQTQSFNLQPLPSVIAFINESLSMFSGNTKSQSDHFWALSMEREPREREDEKIARLLQESGF